MIKLLQARLQQYMNLELSDVQTGIRKGRGTRGQIANIHWIMEKAREFHLKMELSIQPSHPLSSPSPPALNPSQHQALFK